VSSRDKKAAANFEANVKTSTELSTHSLDTRDFSPARGVGDSPVPTTIFGGVLSQRGTDLLNWRKLRRVRKRRLRPHE
jgi:hypothetical protein